MSDIRDGSAGDSTVINALMFGGQIHTFIQPETLDGNEVLTYIEPKSLISISVEDLCAANAGDTSIVVESGLVINSAENHFFLAPFQPDKWVLFVEEKPVPEPVKKESKNSLNLDSAGYRAYLELYLNEIQILSGYFDTINRIHMESVQDAVDIVQTKRIEFTETKDERVDIGGIFFAVAIAIFFEAGIASLIFSKLASAFSNSFFINKTINFFFRFLGSASPKNTLQSAINASRETVTKAQKILADHRNERLLKKLPELNSQNLAPEGPEFTPNFTNAAFLDALQKTNKPARAEILAAITIKNETEVLKELEGKDLESEVIKIGKEEFDKFAGTYKLNPKSFVKDVAKAGIPQAPKAFKDKKHQSVIIPLDVYFKSNIQNFYNNPVFIIKEIENLVRELLNDLLLGSFEEKSNEVHQEIVDILPTLASIENAINDLRKIFNGSFEFTIAKDVQTKEYELMIWSLLLKNKVRPVTTTNHAEDVEAIAGIVGKVFGDPEFRKNIPLRKNIIDISDDLCEYMLKRFGITSENQNKNLKIAIAEMISDIISQVDNKTAQINSRLSRSDAERYNVEVSAYTQK